MEMIDFSLRKMMPCILASLNVDDTLGSVFVQILHAIYKYQKIYRIVHGDLHEDNIFIEFVTENTVWKGQKVLDVDYYHYKIEEVDIFITGGRLCPFIVKIGDWGLSCKYSSPMIIQNIVLTTGYRPSSGRDPVLPNFYSSAYDVVYITKILWEMRPENKFISKILAWCLGLSEPYTLSQISDQLDAKFLQRYRPRIEKLENFFPHVSALSILKNKELMGSYISEEAKESSILFGK
jgi:serine/threonine protein kinase